LIQEKWPTEQLPSLRYPGIWWRTEERIGDREAPITATDPSEIPMAASAIHL
jgi:hypothetical protein